MRQNVSNKQDFQLPQHFEEVGVEEENLGYAVSRYAVTRFADTGFTYNP